MRKKLLGVSLLVILLSLVAYGTWAYLTVEETTTNVITTGTVDIALSPAAGVEAAVMPGKSVDRPVAVQNMGTGDAWIRVYVHKEVQSKDGGALSAEKIALDINSEQWILSDGFYYYTVPVAPEEITENLFNTVTFGADMGNEYQNCTAYVDVVAQAVQLKNNEAGDNVLEAKGWPELVLPGHPANDTPADSGNDEPAA